MSGDVQPRKRKDKRRKKEDEDAGTPPPTLVSASEQLPDNLTIHVHKDRGTGGHWCARIIFFALLALLVGLIGIIILEHRGTTDVDTPIAESRWATVFDGWVDEVLPLHDEEPHDEPGDDHDEASKEESGEVDEDSQESEQADEENNVDADSEQNNEPESYEEVDRGENEASEETADAENVDRSTDVQDSGEEESDAREHVDSNEEQDDEEDDENEQPDSTEVAYDSNESAEREETGNDEDDNGDAALEEIDNESGEDDDGTEKSEDPIINDSDNEIDASIEGIKASAENHEDGDEASTEFLGLPGVNELDDNSAEPLEEVEDEEPEEVLDVPDDEPEVEELEEVPTGLAVKFGVGVALVIAAHFVLVKRWNNVENNVNYRPTSDEESPDLSRRNTIVPPPRAKQVMRQQYESQNRDGEKIRVRDYENLRSQYDNFELDDDSVRDSTDDTDLWVRRSPLPAELKLLRNPSDRDTSDEEEEEDEEDDEEHVSDEEQPSASEDEGEDEGEEIDDTELVAKLGTKYGKLPTPPESEDEELDDEELEEEEEEEDEDLDDEEEDDEEIGGWKRVTIPTDSRGQSNDGAKAATSTASKQKPSPGGRSVDYDDIIDPEDALILEEITAGRDQTAVNRVAYYDDALKRHPASPQLGYEYAKALDDLAEERRDNSHLRRAIAAYEKVLEFANRVTPGLFLRTGERCIDRMRFISQHRRAEDIHKKLISRFPEQPRFRNQLVVTYLMQNKLSEAKTILQSTLSQWPDDGFALVHYGFVLKTGDNRLAEAIKYLKAGIDTADEGTIDGRFYFQLGDALARLGKQEEAMKVYEDGVEKGVFRSVYQRSLYNVNRLTGRPWWTAEETSYAKLFELLEKNWQIIKAEGLAALSNRGNYENESENLKDTGDWKQFELFARGHTMKAHCMKTPRTCSLIEQFPAAAKCRRGQTKFSVMVPGTHVWPHCGPTNCRLRAHLGLTGTNNTFIRVGRETRSWMEGKVMIFDDSFEHEVWHNGTETRLVLIVDVWHPELTESEKAALPAI